ncbi:MAG: glycosyltransferase [Pseudomonadaceae bacterium]|nr:glycosyltransferase [Pseudomonadaceae bacterium]
MDNKKICIVLPCYNEEKAIQSVINDFRTSIPHCEVHVFDNLSTDNTAAVAKEAGAIVHCVPNKGKGYVVQAIFRDIQADIYVLADGDGTYPANEAKGMIDALLKNNADLVIGCRKNTYHNSSSRRGHYFGNQLLTHTVNRLFGSHITDLLSGYRVMSGRFVKTIPLFSKGFEVETAMTIHAVEVGAKILDYPIEYLPRTEGTESKLNTWSDGRKILVTILTLYKDYEPKVVYGIAALMFFSLSLTIGVPVILEYFQTGLVPRFPSAILATGLMIISFFTAFTGVTLSSISKARQEMKKLAFLAFKN